MEDVLREAWFWWRRACTRDEARKVLLGEDKLFTRMCSAEEFDRVWPVDSRCPIAS